MKIIAFTIPVRQDQTVIVQEEMGVQFYPHLHRHEEIQLTWIQQGTGTLIVGEHLHNFQVGNIYLFAANLPHLFKNEGPTSVSQPQRIAALSLFFRQDNPLWHLPELKQLKQFFQQMPGAYHVKPAFLLETQQTFHQIAERSESMRLAPFIELMLGLVRRPALAVMGESVISNVSDREGLRMNTILQYAMQHFQRTITLEEIAREVHMVPGSFCRFFKQRTGKTFMVFLNEIRIREACRQLAFQPDRQIAEIAFQCGFKNVSSFNRVFRQIKQQSPSGYLASLREVV